MLEILFPPARARDLPQNSRKRSTESDKKADAILVAQQPQEPRAAIGSAITNRPPSSTHLGHHKCIIHSAGLVVTFKAGYSVGLIDKRD